MALRAITVEPRLTVTHTSRNSYFLAASNPNLHPNWLLVTYIL